ncbi:hypothetical protein GFM13_34885 [Rhizobium leguminosarum bv. viciae]|nr:hypothetical protein [Rhizobium leguminosarum bv. viciae]
MKALSLGGNRAGTTCRRHIVTNQAVSASSRNQQITRFAQPSTVFIKLGEDGKRIAAEMPINPMA